MKSDKQKQFINNLLQVAAIVAVICVIILLFFRTSIFTGALKRFHPDAFHQRFCDRLSSESPVRFF